MDTVYKVSGVVWMLATFFNGSEKIPAATYAESMLVGMGLVALGYWVQYVNDRKREGGSKDPEKME